MPIPSELPSILERIANGTHTYGDLAALRRTFDAGCVKVEGDVKDSIIITDHGNAIRIENGLSLDILRELLQEFSSRDKSDLAQIINVPQFPSNYLLRSSDLEIVKKL